jgi:type IV pilus assembly protein PilW
MNGRPARGFTLIELVIATGVAAIVAAAGVALLITQERAFRATGDDRALQETARLALEDLTTNLRMAGYGIDPAMAFDFGAMATAPMARAPGGAAVAVTGYACATPVQCRDGATSPDELVFLSRDPYFNHPASGVPTTSRVSIQGPLRAPLRRGQILQLICSGSDLDWAYVTVGTEVAATNGSPVDIPLAAGNGTAFPLQNGWLARPCFQAGAFSVLKVNLYRYFVATYTEAGVVQPWGTPGARPFLMLDQGLLDTNGGAIQTVVAPDVEDLQVTYLFPGAQAPAAVAVPATVGAQLTDAAGGVDLAPLAGAPTYASPRGDPTRLSNYPGNIRGARVAISVRSATARPGGGLPLDDRLPVAGNRAARQAPEAGFRHMLFEATVTPRNLDARTPYLPFNSPLNNANVGGG